MSPSLAMGTFSTKLKVYFHPLEVVSRYRDPQPQVCKITCIRSI